jgi:hypothetical protein
MFEYFNCKNVFTSCKTSLTLFCTVSVAGGFWLRLGLFPGRASNASFSASDALLIAFVTSVALAFAFSTVQDLQ